MNRLTRRILHACLFLALVALLPGSLHAQSPGTAFSYQGQLRDSSGQPISDICDFRFALFDAANAGTQIGGAVNSDAVPVADGLFAISLDFGNGAFDGGSRWLEIGVRCPAGSGSFTTLNPRRAIQTTPYAMHAGSAGSVAWSDINGIPNTITDGDNQILNLSNTTLSISNGNSVGLNALGINSSVAENSATVSGGGSNTASAGMATVGGGFENIAEEYGATVAGGRANNASGIEAAIGGGHGNTANINQATVGGGIDNTASGIRSTVSGGRDNTANGPYSAVSGGASNAAASDYTVVSGGQGNMASGMYAVVPGGLSNTASGKYSFAAGRKASATHDGSFVWADGFDVPLASTATNQFSVRAKGGFRFLTNTDHTTGCSLAAGGGSWDCTSDRNMKEQLETVDPVEVLNAVATLPISTWNYRTQEQSVRHMGPMAQDFAAAFGLGMDETTISMVDADGVSLAAIQGLYIRSQEQVRLIQTQQETLEAQGALLAELRQQVDALEAGNE